MTVPLRCCKSTSFEFPVDCKEYVEMYQLTSTAHDQDVMTKVRGLYVTTPSTDNDGATPKVVKYSNANFDVAMGI